MLIDEIMNMVFLFQYFDLENWVNFFQKISKTSQNKT